MTVEFSSPQFKQNIEELKARIEAQYPRIEQEPTPEKQREVVRAEIKGFVGETQKAAPPALSSQAKKKAAAMQTLEPSQQVGALVTMVFEKGLEEALAVARAIENPAILDEFHDTLADYFFQELVSRGIIKSF